MNETDPIQLSRHKPNKIEVGKTYRPAPLLLEVSDDMVRLPTSTLVRNDDECFIEYLKGDHGGGIGKAALSNDEFEGLKEQAKAAIYEMNNEVERAIVAARQKENP